MLADFPYVWVSRLDLWQVPRTAQSTNLFGVGTAQVTKNTLFYPFRRTRRANTIGPIAPKLCRPRDLARHFEDPKSERLASTLAPTTLPQKCTPEFAAGACEPTKIGCRRSGPTSPRPCRLTSIRMGERTAPLAGPQDRPIDLPFWGFGGHVRRWHEY